MLSSKGKFGVFIISSHSRPTMTAPINHQIYAERHGYDYLFDVTPYRLNSKYDQKFKSILSNLHRADWLMWLDEDAYIMDHSLTLDRFIPDDSTTQFVFCNSPVNQQGESTALNSGVFFIRNTQEAKSLLIEALEVDIVTVRQWWDSQKYGLFTNGDQDKIVYVFAKHGLIGSVVKIAPFTAFDARVYHFNKTPDQHFICHFCGFDDKQTAVRRIQRKFALNAYLLSNGEMDKLEAFETSLFATRKRSLVLESLVKQRMKLNPIRLARLIKKCFMSFFFP
jgi:hypothetical protein